MEDKIDKLTRTIEEIKKQLQTMQARFNEQDITLGKIMKDVGGTDSKNLSEVVYKMDSYMSRDYTDVQTITREVIETRRMATNIELMMKEVMKGMAILYSNVDELEENLLPERKTK
jgi:hypothetical protein